MSMHSIPLRTCVILAVISLVAVASPSYAGNIIQNPGFEDGVISPWDQFEFVPAEHDPAEYWQATETYPHSGNFCAVGWGSRLFLQQEFTPIPVAELVNVTEFSCWIRQDDVPEGGEVVYIGLLYDDPTDDARGTGCLTLRRQMTSEWEFYDGLADLQSSAASASSLHGPGCCLMGINIVGTFETNTYVDDCVLNMVPEPTSFAGLALCLLFVRRRRS